MKKYLKNQSPVLITDLDGDTQYFTVDGSECRNEIESSVYKLVQKFNDVICQGKTIGYQSTNFNETNWQSLKKYGIGKVFKIHI